MQRVAYVLLLRICDDGVLIFCLSQTFTHDSVNRGVDMSRTKIVSGSSEKYTSSF